MEGGDIIFNEDTLWIGHSERTSPEAAEFLKQELPGFEIHTSREDFSGRSTVLILRLTFPRKALGAVKDADPVLDIPEKGSQGG